MTSLFVPEGTITKFKKIKNVKPFGSSILVQRLNADETLATNLYVDKAADVSNVPQCRIVEFGPSVKPSDLGLKVGDRVVCVGTSTLVPSLDNDDHEYNVIEVHNIKALLIEE